MQIRAPGLAAVNKTGSSKELIIEHGQKLLERKMRLVRRWANEMRWLCLEGGNEGGAYVTDTSFCTNILATIPVFSKL